MLLSTKGIDNDERITSRNFMVYLSYLALIISFESPNRAIKEITLVPSEVNSEVFRGINSEVCLIAQFHHGDVMVKVQILQCIFLSRGPMLRVSESYVKLGRPELISWYV